MVILHLKWEAKNKLINWNCKQRLSETLMTLFFLSLFKAPSFLNGSSLCLYQKIEWSIVCLVNEPVFSFRIHNLGVGLSGYKWLIHHLLDVWCWESHLTSLYHHLPKLYCDHTISINKWNNAWAVPDEWWTLFLFIMSKYSVFSYPPTMWSSGLLTSMDSLLFSLSCSHCFSTLCLHACFIRSRHPCCPFPLKYSYYFGGFILTFCLLTLSLIFSVKPDLLWLFFLLVTNFGNIHQ